MTLGTLIRQERLKHPRYRQTMKALADAVGISLEHMRRIELSYAFPSGDLLEKIIETLSMGSVAQSQAWLLLAERQLDTATAKHVTILADENGLAFTAARSASIWVSKNYAISDDEGKELHNVVLKALLRKANEIPGS